MKIPSEYSAVLRRDKRVASDLIAMLPGSAECPDMLATQSFLEGCGLGVTRTSAAPVWDYPGSEWEIMLWVRGEGEEDEVILRAWACPSDTPHDLLLGWAELTPEEEAQTRESRWSLGVSTFFGERPLWDYHRQLRLLHALAPEAVVALDSSAHAMRSGEWIREAASSRVPPSPMALFTIHAVQDDVADSDSVWLHTHGLLRCGTFELEMLSVPADQTGPLGELLNAVAARFIEESPPQPGEPFAAGAGIDLIWLPWQEVTRDMPPDAQGGLEERDASHSDASGILLAPPRGLLNRRPRSPAVYAGRLADNPVIYVSTMETERMSLLAAERFGTFANLQKQFAQDDEFVFLVKLGYPMDGAGEDDEREHLWFEVHEISEDAVDATLVNQPHHIARMNEGQRQSHSLLRMSDWAVLCEHGQFNPDTIIDLERKLG